MRKFCEILAPIADVKFVKKLIRAGATALYCGLEGFSSRPKSSDMTVDDIIEVKKISSKFNVKLYVAINAAILDEHIPEIMKQIRILDENGIDAFIVSDIGLIHLLTNVNLNADIHISTLAGVHNVETVKYYPQQTSY